MIRRPKDQPEPKAKRRRHAHLTIESDRLILRAWQGSELLLGAGVRGIWAGTVKGHIVDLRHLPDLVAYLEYRNIVVKIDEAK